MELVYRHSIGTFERYIDTPWIPHSWEGLHISCLQCWSDRPFFVATPVHPYTPSMRFKDRALPWRFAALPAVCSFCDGVYTHGGLAAHQAECDGRIVACSFGCGNTLKRPKNT